jgi:hypothetical protein
MTHGPLSPAEYEQLEAELRFNQDSRYRGKVWTVIGCAVLCLGIGVSGYFLWGVQ